MSKTEHAVKPYEHYLDNFRQRFDHLTNAELREFLVWHEKFSTELLTFVFAHELHLRNMEGDQRNG